MRLETQAINSSDPYLHLAATVLYRAINDARRGDLSGLFFMSTPAAQNIMSALDMDEDGARRLAKKEEDKVYEAAEKRKHRPKGCGPNKPFLFLVPIPDDPARLRIAGELAWDFPGPEIAASHLATVSRQYKIVVIDNPGRPHRSLLDHFTTWLNRQFEIQNLKGETL
jgi:hypothetical protein